MDDKKPTPRKLTREIGQSGTRIFKGHISDEEYNPKLTGLQAIRNYDIMRRSDATVHATLQVCKLPILSATWDITPASEDEADVKVANRLRHDLFKDKVIFHRFIREALSCLDYGFSVAEFTLGLKDTEDGPFIGLDKIGFRKQISILKWETDAGEEGIVQQLDNAPNAQIPMGKLVVFTNDKEGDNYTGISLLRYAYKHWHIKDKLDIINAIALEKQGIGVPVLKKPANADTAELEIARQIMRNIRANEEAYIEIPVGYEVDMMDMKANTTKEILPSINYHDRQIMKSVLAQFLELGASEASGSRAVSQDHSRLFMLSEQATARMIRDTIQEQLINRICDLNYSKLPNGYPRLEFSKIGEDDITGISSAIKQFVDAGILTVDDSVENKVRAMFDLRPLDDDIKKSATERKEARMELVPEAQPAGNDPKTDPKQKTEKQKKDITASIEDAEKARRELVNKVMAV